MLSLSIFFTEKAKDKVTAKGRPSGIATTITVIAKIQKFNSCPKSLPVSHYLEIPSSIANLTNKIIKIATAETKPNFPISYAIV